MVMATVIDRLVALNWHDSMLSFLIPHDDSAKRGSCKRAQNDIDDC